MTRETDMKKISYRIANFILIAALLLSGTVTAHAASTTEASEKVQLRSDCTLDVRRGPVQTYPCSTEATEDRRD